jgi:hypothetical protein
MIKLADLGAALSNEHALERKNALLAARISQLEAGLEGLLYEWDKLTRYGSPMAKAANERVAIARALVKDRG